MWADERLEVNIALGRQAIDAMWRSMVRQDIGQGQGVLAERSWYLQKAFDLVDGHLMVLGGGGGRVRWT